VARTPLSPIAAPADAHEWVSFEDPDEDRTWVFDVTFLASSYMCIFGQGCQGVLTGPAPELVQGCCSYGAHFTGPDDVARVEAMAARLPDHLWQFAPKGRSRSGQLKVTKVDKEGDTVTRMADGACIFLNRPGWSSGPGCSLHQAALANGERPLDWKPDVCWQVPVRREDVEDGGGHVTSTVRQWDRRHWGAGGAEFHWWCTEASEAFVGREAVYQSMQAELTEIVGQPVYRMIAAYLASRPARAKVPHPAVRIELSTKP